MFPFLVTMMEPKLSKHLVLTCYAMLNKGQKVNAIIMDLSRAFDTLNHKLFLKKLQAYRFDKKSLFFTESYFTNREQRTKIGDSFSKYQRIITGGPQGSILRPLFFYIFIDDLIFLLTNQPYAITPMIIHFTLPAKIQVLSLVSWSSIWMVLLKV